MKIFIICSKWCYQYVEDIKKALTLMGYEVILPDNYQDSLESKTSKSAEELMKEYSDSSLKKSQEADAILVLNFDKIQDGSYYPSYIGGSIFLEMYNAYLLKKPIFLYNEIPEGILKEELIGMNPYLLEGDLTKLRYELSNHFSKYLDFNTYQSLKQETNLYEKAKQLVTILFKDKKDKSGSPYLNHLLRVSDSLEELDTKVAGLLHDVLEDIETIEKEDLLKIGFKKEVIEIVEIVTNQKLDKTGLSKDEKLSLYNEKIDKIIKSGNQKAIALKIADMSDNTDANRVARLTEEQQEWFHKKYTNNLEKLKQAKEGKKVYVRH